VRRKLRVIIQLRRQLRRGELLLQKFHVARVVFCAGLALCEGGVERALALREILLAAIGVVNSTAKRVIRRRDRELAFHHLVVDADHRFAGSGNFPLRVGDGI